MIIKRYIVEDMNEAVTLIRRELGKEAVIISQRKIRKPGLNGMFSKKSIEVTAAVERLANTPVVKNNNSFIREGEKVENNDESIKKSIEAIKRVIDNEKKEKEAELNKNEEIKHEDTTDEVTTYLLKEMKEMKEIMNNIVSNNKSAEKTPRKSKLQVRLEETDINDALRKKIITKLKSIDENLDEEGKLKVAIQKMISVTDSQMDGKVILVGPTGVGKTTTIAKLAGKLSLIEKKKVGLITIDTYRIGAVEQLKTYAEIMGLPFKVVISLNEMEMALESMKDCDVILIDTTGRSSKNATQISELKTFVDKADTNNVHLVVSSTTKNKDIDSIIEGFKPLNFSKLIITKLDETLTYGSILNIAESAKKPISYVTIGQNVPDDIKILSAEEISNLILGVDCIC